MAVAAPPDARVVMSAPAGARTDVVTAATAIHDALAAHRGELVGFVRKRAGHLVDPEDVVHRAAARALASAGSLREPERARAWLFRIVRNEMADELRRIGLPVAELPDDLADPAPPRERGEPCKCALAISKDLRPDYRTILERAVVDDVPVTEVAKELGITANNAMVRLHRARKALRDKVTAHCGVTTMAECSHCTC